MIIFKTFHGLENFHITFQDFPYFSSICMNPDHRLACHSIDTSTGMTSTKRQMNHFVATIDHAQPQLSVSRYTSGHLCLEIHRCTWYRYYHRETWYVNIRLENILIFLKISKITDFFSRYFQWAFADTLLKYKIYYQIVVCVCVLCILGKVL